MPCREGGRGTENDFTLLLPSCPLPMPSVGSTNWNLTGSTGQGAEGAVDESQLPGAQSRGGNGRECM